jgi:NitT/TauT family transport system substrate-binding protein
MVSHSRRRFLQGGAVAAGALVTGNLLGRPAGALGSHPLLTSGRRVGGSGDLTSIAFQTSWIPSVEFGGSYLAAERGYWTDEGLDVELLPGGPNSSVEPIVDAGTALVGITSSDYVARANLEGASFKIIGAGFQKNPFAVLSLGDNPVNSPEELYGKRLGVPAADEAVYAAMVEVNGLDEGQITKVPVGFDIAPLTSGEIDALFVFYTEQPVALELAGFEGVTFLLADYGLDVLSHAYFVTEESLADRHDQVVGFLRGEIRGWQDFVANPTDAVGPTLEVYAADVGHNAEAQELQAQSQLDLIVSPTTDEHGLLYMSAEDIDKNVVTFGTLGITGIDASVFTTEILDEIFEGGSSV